MFPGHISQSAKTYSIAILLASLILGCAQSYNENIERGSSFEFRKGHPEVKLSATGFVTPDDSAMVDITANIAFRSMVFKEEEGKQQANLSIEVFIEGQNKGNNVTTTKNYQVQVEKDLSDISESNKSYLFEKELQIAPGEHKIYLTVIDENSGKQVSRTTYVNVPDPTTNALTFTNIKMSGKDTDTDAGWSPITSYDVPSRIDSLIFRFQVMNNSASTPLEVNARLQKIPSDQSVARPMFFSDYSPATIEYIGMNYDDKTTIEQSTRK